MSVAEALDEGSTTVGTLVNVSHVSATPVGATVYCETELLEVEGRKLTFSVKAYDNAGLIGEGMHERFIVFSEKFMARTLAKLTIYDDVMHASWVPAYSNPETFRWLLSQRKSNGELGKEQYTNSEIYG